MARKSAVMCPTCGRTFKSSQGLAGHRRIKHAQTPKGAPPPRPVEREFAEKPGVREPVSAPEPVERESIYKPYPSPPWSATQPTYPQYSPQTQALPPAQLAQPPQPQQPVSAQPLVIKIEAPGTPREEKPLTEADVKGLVEEEILKIPVEAPPKPEVTFSDRIRQIFAEHRERKKKWDDEVIKPLKESTRQIHGTADELSEKTKKLELSLMEGPEKPEIVPVPSEPPKIAEATSAQPLVFKTEAPGAPKESKRGPAEEPFRPKTDFKVEPKQVFQEKRGKEGGWGKVIAAAEESQEKIQGIFKERLEERKKDEESLRPIKEDLGKVGETIAREVKKLYPKEVSKFQPPEAPAKPPEEPTKPPEPKGPAQPEAPAEQQPAGLSMSPGDTILMSERLAREVAAREVNRLLDAKKAKEAEAKKEVPREESPEEAPQRRGIFPVFRRRRFRLLR